MYFNVTLSATAFSPQECSEQLNEAWLQGFNHQTQMEAASESTGPVFLGCQSGSAGAESFEDGEWKVGVELIVVVAAKTKAEAARIAVVAQTKLCSLVDELGVTLDSGEWDIDDIEAVQVMQPDVNYASENTPSL